MVVGCDSAKVTPEEIRHACEGDRQALERLVELVLPIVRVEVSVALQRRGRLRGRDGRQDVDDFVQEVLVHLLSANGRVLQRWDPERGRSLPSFVRLVARHRVARVLEGFRGNPWGLEAAEDGQLDAGDSGPFRRVESRVRLASVLERLQGRLNERGVRLFRLLYVEQRTVAEVCELEGMTRAALDQWSARLRKTARALAEEGES